MADVTCDQCSKTLSLAEPREVVEDKVFCAECYAALADAIKRHVGSLEEDINYPMALVGGVAGGAAGGLLWYASVVLSGWMIGIVAIAIGIGVAKGILMLGGGKRSRGLQIMSVAISVVAYVIASYAVIHNWVNESLAADGGGSLPFFVDLGTAMELLALGFEPFDLLFLGIVVYEAWRIPAPLRM